MTGPTLTLQDITARVWPVVVVGAGVAGTALSAALARRGLDVLLIERSRHPRPKTCGGCLNARAQNSLGRLGMRRTLEGLAAQPLKRLRMVHTSGMDATVSLEHDAQHTLGISRQSLDSGLLQAALDEGVSYIDQTRAVSTRLLGEHRLIALRSEDGHNATATAQMVIACDGLGSAMARCAGLAEEARPSANDKVGASLLMSANAFAHLPEETITMACGTLGYVGLARVEGGLWSLAAALRTRAISDAGGILAAIRQTLASCGIPAPLELWDRENTINPVTCPRMRRSVTRPSAERLLLVGDASGYVEPLTGEGMAWALASAEEAVEHAQAAVANGWSERLALSYDQAWQDRVKNRQAPIQAIRRVLDSQPLTAAALASLKLAPGLGSAVARSLVREDQNGAASPETQIA
ncbi:MAG: FAD-dependent monooxygenase [Sumerlaeia bacterium]